MRWESKGHELDEFVQEWNINSEYYIWGTSTTGQSFYNKFKNILKIKGFVDSDEEKHGSIFCEHNVYSIDRIELEKNRSRIIVASGAYSEIAEYLFKLGYVEGKDFCDSRIFVGTYFQYNYNKVYLYRTDISITSKCNLRCESCNMLMPYFKTPSNKSLDEIKNDVDLYFKWVDNIQLLNILGGEPFIHPNLLDIIEYIGKNYMDRIEHIEFFSNGIIMPSEDILKALKKYVISIQISDYSNTLSNLKNKIDLFVGKLDEYGIKYRRTINNKWLNFGFPNADNYNLSDEQMVKFFDKCYAPFRGLDDKKLYYCHLDASAVKCGEFKKDSNNYFNLENYDEKRKRELMEFDLGYMDLGYSTFCRKCNGCFSVNNNFVEVAKQMGR